MSNDENLILTKTEVAEAIYEDYDFSETTLIRYARSASSFIKEKTGYDFGADTEKEPLAVQCAMLYVRQLHFGGEKYNREHDYTLGISGLIVDLQNIARRKINGEST